MRYLRICLAFFAGPALCVLPTYALSTKHHLSYNPTMLLFQDTLKRSNEIKPEDSIVKIKSTNLYNKLSDRVKKDPNLLSLFPANSLQQNLKGNFAGVNIQETSGEPGSIQNILIRGSAFPLLNKKNVYDAQPLVVLDGVPLIGEHPFAYDIQQYDYNRIGPSTNLLANIDINNIASVEVLKDLAAISSYGPRGVNGVILLKSKPTASNRAIYFNSHVGLAQRPTVNTINGKYENDFRQRFYSKYTTNGRYSDDEVYPVYLSDSLNNVYSGKSDWSDLYYRNALVYGINVGLSGGTDRANFRFTLGNTKSGGVADDTGLDRYSAMFNISMKPVEWLQFTTMINANRFNRQRNRSLRDRFADVNYFPDMSAPLPPNKDFYASYLAQYDRGFDDNKSNVIEGYAKLVASLGRLQLSSTFNIDYNEGYRDVFYARTLLQGNSYASNYYGYNQRLMWENKASYDFRISEDHKFNAEVGQSTMWDLYKYSLGYAYKGTNDFIKLNLLQSDPNKDNYLGNLAFPRELTYRFLDKTQDNLVSFFGRTSYSFKDKYFVNASLRADGSSNAQPTTRWFYSPVISAAWSIKNELLKEVSVVDDAILRASVGRLGRIHSYDNYAQGPQYSASVGYTGNPTVPGYNGFGVLTRSYTFGWVGYGVPWAYSDQLNVGADIALLKNRLSLSLDVYSKTEKDLLLGIPAYAEYGYKQSIESGMSVNNTGIDLAINASVLNKGKFSWTSALNFNHNQNKLKELPRDLQQIIIGNRMLKIGEAFDQYWVFRNDGIYNSNAEIPVVNGQPLKFNGTALRAGDPKWRDQNGDNIIDDNDKVMLGHYLPTMSGGWDNNFKCGNWTLNTSFFFNFGRKILNQEMANRFDFVNREGNTDISSVKEITFWEKRGDYSKYPLYNPWSTIIPYRPEQDLFLESGDFLKLRSVSLGYDLTERLKSTKAKINRLYVYGSINNVFTITKYTGQDPELVSYDGINTGYGLPIPRIYTLGIKMEL